MKAADLKAKKAELEKNIAAAKDTVFAEGTSEVIKTNIINDKVSRLQKQIDRVQSDLNIINGKAKPKDAKKRNTNRNNNRNNNRRNNAFDSGNSVLPPNFKL